MGGEGLGRAQHSPISISTSTSTAMKPFSTEASPTRKVRFADTEDIADFHQFDVSPATAPSRSAAPQPPAAAPAAASAAAQPAQQPNYGAYPTPPYGYYYNPYGYNPYEGMPSPQGWPQQPPGQQQHEAVSQAAMPPQQPAAGFPATVAAGAVPQDPNRMQLMARSVSITVNPAQQEEMQQPGAPVSATYFPTTGNSVVAASGAAPRQPAGPPPVSAEDVKKQRERREAVEEEKLLRWVERRLRFACMMRAFRMWTGLCTERWWKMQLALRDQQTALLAKQLRHLESRTVRLIRRYRVKLWLAAWVAYCDHCRAKAAALQSARAHADRVMLSCALVTWMGEVRESRTEAVTGQRAQRVHERRRRRMALAAWRGLVGRRARKTQLVQAADEFRANRARATILGCWRYLAWFYAAENAAVQRRQHTVTAGMMEAWRELTARKKQENNLVAAAHGRHEVRLTSCTFFAWRAFVDGRAVRAVHAAAQQMQAEMERLRAENERLARVVDSGDWGRDRVAELTQAGQVLSQERDALLKLVESLPGNRPRRGSSMLSTSNTPAHVSTPAPLPAPSSRRASLAVRAPPRELQVIGSAVDTGSPSRRGSTNMQPFAMQHPPAAATPAAAAAAAEPRWPPPSAAKPPAELPANARLKMNIRAGSSFNALVRALKQDLLTSGALGRSPSGAFAADKVAFHQVEMTSEGGVKIQGMADTSAPGFSFPRAGAKPQTQKNSAGGEGEAPVPRSHPPNGAGAMGGRSVAFGKRLYARPGFEI